MDAPGGRLDIEYEGIVVKAACPIADGRTVVPAKLVEPRGGTHPDRIVGIAKKRSDEVGGETVADGVLFPFQDPVLFQREAVETVIPGADPNPSVVVYGEGPGRHRGQAARVDRLQGLKSIARV